MIGALIQARTSSSRLPRKVLKVIEGKTVLEHVIFRVKKVKNINKVILATSDRKEDDVLENIARKSGVDFFRGSLDNVLDRFYQAAKKFKIDSIVRITADCPLLDSKVAKEVVDFYLKNDYDYVSNANPPTFPDGLDTEIFSFKSLERAWKNAQLPSEKEHVTPWIYKNPDKFKLGNLFSDKDLSRLRLTLDEEKDFILINEIYKELYHKNQNFGLKEILQLFEKKPELVEINQSIKRNEGYAKSLKEDKQARN